MEDGEQQREKTLGVLQCDRCGKSIDENDPYHNIAVTTGLCPSHEDYLDWDPEYEEYFCGECGDEIIAFTRRKP